MHYTNQVHNAMTESALFLTRPFVEGALCLEGVTNDSQGSCKDRDEEFDHWQISPQKCVITKNIWKPHLLIMRKDVIIMNSSNRSFNFSCIITEIIF